MGQRCSSQSTRQHRWLRQILLGLTGGVRRFHDFRDGSGIRPLSRLQSNGYDHDRVLARMQVGDVLSGVTGQKEIEIVSDLSDCGYPFEVGMGYVVYAYKNAEGRLQTNSCTRTRPLAGAAEDLKYFQAMAGAPATGEILVRTSYPGVPEKSGMTIVAESQESRHTAQTDSAGNARFTGLPPGEYSMRAQADGDLPDDPKVQLHAKGCLDVTLKPA